MKVAIICELKERELQFLSVLRKKIELNGHRVKIIPQKILCGLKILIFKPDIIIINGLRSDNSFYRQILIPKIIFHSLIVSLYSEQVGKHGGIANTYDNPKILNNVDAHVVWGEGFAEALSALRVPRGKIWILGSMALDLPYYIDNGGNKTKNLFAEKYNLEKNKKWILVSDNIIRKGDQIVHYNNIRKEFNCGIKKIAKELNDCEFIFRPHPDNRKSDLKKLHNDFFNCSNIKVIGDEHNILWSSLSEAMIVWRSTSSIEAWVAGKEVFALQTSENKFDYWHSKFMPNFKNADELSKELKRYLEEIDTIDDKLITNREKYMRKWFYKIDGESIDRVSHLIDIIQDESHSELKVEKYNLVGIFKAYLLEVQWFVLKLFKSEYGKFNIKDKEILNNFKYIKPLNHSRNNYHIKLSNFGNYLINQDKPPVPLVDQ